MKLCTHPDCPIEGLQPESNFYKRKNALDGLESICKVCHNRMTKDNRKANPERHKAYDRQYKRGRYIPKPKKIRVKKIKSAQEIEAEKNYMKSYLKERTKREQQEFVSMIKSIGCVCQGCMENFSGCTDRALVMIFERCHFHTKKCQFRDEQTFVACMLCNRGQHTKCGYFSNGNFISTCEAIC